MSQQQQTSTIRVPVPNAAALESWQTVIGVTFVPQDVVLAKASMASHRVDDMRTLRWMDATTTRHFVSQGKGWRFFALEGQDKDDFVSVSEKTEFYDPYLIVCFSKVDKQTPDQQAESTINDEWRSLQQQYRVTLEVTAGCGQRAQHEIDAAHDRLVQFAKKNNKFKNDIPVWHRCSDDGHGGVSSGLAAAAITTGMREGPRDEACTVQ